MDIIIYFMTFRINKKEWAYIFNFWAGNYLRYIIKNASLHEGLNDRLILCIGMIVGSLLVNKLPSKIFENIELNIFMIAFCIIFINVILFNIDKIFISLLNGIVYGLFVELTKYLLRKKENLNFPEIFYIGFSLSIITKISYFKYDSYILDMSIYVLPVFLYSKVPDKLKKIRNVNLDNYSLGDCLYKGILSLFDKILDSATILFLINEGDMNADLNLKMIGGVFCIFGLVGRKYLNFNMEILYLIVQIIRAYVIWNRFSYEIIMCLYLLERIVGTLTFQNRVEAKKQKRNTPNNKYCIFYGTCCNLGTIVTPLLFLMKQNKNIDLYLYLSIVALMFKIYQFGKKYISLKLREIQLLTMLIISILLITQVPSNNANKIDRNTWLRVIENEVPLNKFVNLNNQLVSSHGIVCSAVAFPGRNKWNILSPLYWGHAFMIAQNDKYLFTAGNTGKCKPVIGHDNLMVNSKGIPHKLDVHILNCKYIDEDEWKKLMFLFEETYKENYCKLYNLLLWNCVHFTDHIFTELGYFIISDFIPRFNLYL